MIIEIEDQYCKVAEMFSKVLKREFPRPPVIEHEGKTLHRLPQLRGSMFPPSARRCSNVTFTPRGKRSVRR